MSSQEGKESLVQYQSPVEVYNVESMAGSRPKNHNLLDSRLAIDGILKIT